MKIGIYVARLDPSGGGFVRYFFRLAEWLARRGHEVAIFTKDAKQIPAGVRIHRLSGATGADLGREIAAAGLDVLMADPARAQGYDGPGINVLRSGYGTVSGRRRSLNWIRNPLLRGLAGFALRLNPWSTLHGGAERRRYLRTDPPPHTVAISQLMRDDIRADYGLSDERLHVVYNGVDTVEFSPQRCAALRGPARAQWGLSPADTCFLFVGHNFRRKGLRELIKAAAITARTRRDFGVVVVGKGRRGAKLPYSWRAKLSGCGDLIRFVGAVSDMPRAYAAADVLVAPGWHDAFGFVLLEAAACGLPVITTRATGASELIREGVDGFVLETPADTAALADRMMRLLEPAERERMGAAARGMAQGRTEAANFEAMERVFAAAAAERGAQPQAGVTDR